MPKARTSPGTSGEPARPPRTADASIISGICPLRAAPPRPPHSGARPAAPSAAASPVLILALLLAGCSLAPDYVRPPSPVPSALPVGESGGQGGVPAVRAPDVGAGVFYPEPRLRALISKALSGNRELAVSYLSVLEARARSSVARSERFPMLEGMGSETVSGGREKDRTQSFSAELRMPSFDLDLFGRLRSMDAAAREEYLSSNEAWRAMRIALVSQVAEGYLAWRAAAQKERAAELALASYGNTLGFVERRVVSGQSGLLELEQARGQEQFARTRVAAMRAERQMAQNMLNLL
ncbi:MAG: TolC family protein, partial [Deltaproteobacteria bacterium]|nr:TolC family protein [Deltaproteobacteria bacterium]